MTKKRNLVYVAIVAFGLFGACKKNSASNGIIVMQGSKCTPHDTVQWISKSATARLVKSSSNHITIIADSAQTHVELDIDNYTGPNTYTISPDTGNTAYYRFNTKNGQVTSKARSGNIIIENTGNSGQLLGGFNFVADTFNLQNGTFSFTLNLD